MPSAIFSDEILIPLKNELEVKRNDSASVQNYQSMMNGSSRR
jgi:hypothetical protein